MTGLIAGLMIGLISGLTLYSPEPERTVFLPLEEF